MRVVLDTNVLVSAFIFPGGPPEAAFKLTAGRIELVTSNTLLAEFGRVLTERFGRDRQAVTDAVAMVAARSLIVSPSERLSEIEDDHDDDRVLEAAVAGHAEIIVSGDKHLLRLDTWRGIRVLKPAAFVAEFAPH